MYIIYVVDMDYAAAVMWLIGAYVLFRISAWVIGTAVKLAFTIAFLTLGVLAMSSTVGLF
jgi:hypothetical protein